MNKIRQHPRRVVAIVVMLVIALIAAAASAASADQEEREFTERIQKHFNDVQPPHEYDWSQARANLIAAQDAMALGSDSYTYVTVNNVGIMFDCPSIGFPVPFGTQITNPEKGVDWGQTAEALPQMEPIGLYTPPDVLGTLANCVLPNSDIGIFYSENNINTFMFDVIENPNTGMIEIDPAATSSVDVIRVTPDMVNITESDSSAEPATP